MQRKFFGTFRPSVLMTLGVLWSVGVGIGLYILLDYEMTPGPGGEAPEVWPAQSRIPRHPVVPTLVMLMHPRCTCSHASLQELSRLLTQVQEQVSAVILFYSPDSVEHNWEKTDLWSTATSLPGVRVLRDSNGAEATLFRAYTSGYTVLYDAAGHRLFHGGITPFRGHSGANAGSQAIAALLTHHRAAHQRTPVFGCDVFEATEQYRDLL